MPNYDKCSRCGDYTWLPCRCHHFEVRDVEENHPDAWRELYATEHGKAAKGYCDLRDADSDYGEHVTVERIVLVREWPDQPIQKFKVEGWLQRTYLADKLEDLPAEKSADEEEMEEEKV